MPLSRGCWWQDLVWVPAVNSPPQDPTCSEEKPRAGQLHLRCTRVHLTADTRTETREPALHPRDLQALYKLDKAERTAGNSPRCGERPLLFQAGIKVGSA